MSLSPKQSKAVALLAQGRKSKDVAKCVGVSAQTISGWRKNPEFEATLNTLLLEFLEASRRQMQALAIDAVDTIADLMKSDKSETTRLKTVEVVLHHVGFSDPQKTGLWAWGIGPRTAEEVAQKQSSEKSFEQELSAMLGKSL